MNFNISKQPEYELFRNISEEIINLYGIQVKYYVTDKLHKNHILGEHLRISLDSKKSFSIFILPSKTENWDSGLISNSFGFQNNESLVVYVSVKDIEKIHPNIVNKNDINFDNILGDIVIFDSGKIMEVSMISPLVEGNSNLFCYSDSKNLYKLTLKTHIPYNDEVKDVDDKEDYEKIENLEEIFELDNNQKEEQKKAKRKYSKTRESKKSIEESNFNELFGSLG